MIFDKRTEYKPFEYPEVQRFIDNMNRTFWVHSEVDFSDDIQDFKTLLTDEEREVIKRSLLAIAQVEVTVKTFWGKLYEFLPKPEFNDLGATFSESECRHSSAYARLLEVVGLEEEFKKLLDIPVFRRKLELTEEHLSSQQDFIHKLFFFTIVIENSSLFSQFANMVAFSHFRGMLKNTANMVSWSSIDEQCHADAGVYIINKIFEERPDLRLDYSEVERMVRSYLSYEEELLDWIYEPGELEFFSKQDMLNFMKYRVDKALTQMSYGQVYNISTEQYMPMEWFDEYVFANDLDDFFAKRPTAYTKHDKPITANDLF